MDALDALDVAVREFGERLALVGDGQWTAPTPCDEWDVRYLVAHVVGGNRFATLVLDGMSADEAVEQVMGQPQLGTAPLADLTATAAAQHAAFGATGRLDQPVSHPLGDMPARRFLELRAYDVTLHAWDLARAIGADETLDPALVGQVLGVVERAHAGMGFGITPLGLAGPGASPQHRLLDLTGRRA